MVEENSKSYKHGQNGETKVKLLLVELKSLPSNLRYEFLWPSSIYSVIVNADLNESETQKLLGELRLHRKVLKYTVEYIKDINPSLCIHRILERMIINL